MLSSPALRKARPRRRRRCWPALLALPAALSFLLSACAPRLLGYGVVLWAPKEGGFQTGQTVRVAKESQLQGVYYLQAEGAKGLREISAARVRLFKERGEADAWGKEYADRVNQFAYAVKNSLPVREKPDPEARKIYLLREGQLVKVVGRESRPQRVGAYENYWYEVLTDDGYIGYCFGQYLRPFLADGDPEAQAARLMSMDPALDRLLATVWRPEYFLDMIGSGRIDLVRFRPEMGLFPDPGTRTVRLVTPAYSLIFEYQQVEQVGTGRYVFTGTELRVSLSGDNRIVVSYPYKGRQVSAVYYEVKEDLDEVIARERNRRKSIYDGLTAGGRLLQSTSYGHIELQEDMRFRWNGLGSLASRISRRTAAESGVVDFPYYLSKELRGQYQGVITFRFDGDPEDGGTSFLYTLEDRGIRLVLLRPQDIVAGEAARTGLSPLILFFTFAGS